MRTSLGAFVVYLCRYRNNIVMTDTRYTHAYNAGQRPPISTGRTYAATRQVFDTWLLSRLQGLRYVMRFRLVHKIVTAPDPEENCIQYRHGDQDEYAGEGQAGHDRHAHIGEKRRPSEADANAQNRRQTSQRASPAADGDRGIHERLEALAPRGDLRIDLVQSTIAFFIQHARQAEEAEAMP